MFCGLCVFFMVFCGWGFFVGKSPWGEGVVVEGLLFSGLGYRAACWWFAGRGCWLVIAGGGC